MEALNLVEVVLNNDTEVNESKANPSSSQKSSPIKGLNESVTITVTRTPGRPNNVQKISGKPANFAMLSPSKIGRNSDAIRTSPREEMVCNGCERVFKYKAAFIRHEAQCGLPLALRVERAAIVEAKKAAEKAAEMEKRKTVEKLPELRCVTCLKQFHDTNAFKSHDFEACAAERATYTFVCGVCHARFKYKNHMRRHEDSHNNVRRFSCDVCTTAFLRPDHLKRHMMRMHGIFQLPIQSAPEVPVKIPSPIPRAVLPSDQNETRTITKNVPMQCPMCSKVLSRRDHVLRHMRNVHHIVNGSRRGRVSQDGNQVPGFEIDGLMDFDGNNSNQDDEDGSENQSMTSNDGLCIDESFESIKRESDSPMSANDEDRRMAETADISRGQFYEKSQCDSSGQMSSKSTNDFFDQRNLGVKLGPYSPVPSEKYALSNGGVVNGSGILNDTIGLSANSSFKTSDGKSMSNSAAIDGTLVKSEPEDMTKDVHKRSSDGNQNVLSNGHGARNTEEDWINNLVSLNGWQ